MAEEKFLTEAAIRKWKPVLDHKDMSPITDAHKRATMATLLENQEKAIKEQMLVEASPGNAVGGGMSSTISGQNANMQGYDPILIQLVRRAMPNLMAYDICGVQAMSAPTGLIFAMRTKYGGQGGTEALFQEPITTYSGSTFANSSGGSGAAAGGAAVGNTAAFGANLGVDPFAGSQLGDSTLVSGITTGSAIRTSTGEGEAPNEMAFSIERVAVQAATRMLAASYSVELAQDLKAVHGLDAETELANILSTEILAEINREVVRTVYKTAKLGAQQGDLYYKTVIGGLSASGSPVGGVYDLIQDSDGRWSAEKFRGLMFQIERECNQIAKETRRGKLCLHWLQGQQPIRCRYLLLPVCSASDDACCYHRHLPAKDGIQDPLRHGREPLCRRHNRWFRRTQDSRQCLLPYLPRGQPPRRGFVIDCSQAKTWGRASCPPLFFSTYLYGKHIRI